MIIWNLIKGVFRLALLIVSFLVKRYIDMLIEAPLFTIILTIISIITWNW